MALSRLFPDLPVELLCEIIKFLPLTDLQTLSLASRFTRSLAIPFMFEHLRYTEELPLKIKSIHQARKDVKAVIKKLELFSCKDIGQDEDSLVVFRFLETLPNLQVLNVQYLRTAYLSELISSIRHTTLLELQLVLQFQDNSDNSVKGPPTLGLAGLKKLSIRWCAYDNPNEPGSSLAHLHELIRPTLTTLVKLVLDINRLPYVFDLHLLKPAADTLRRFEYLHSDDESILDTIPAILPHLTNLTIIWIKNFKILCVLWKDAHIQAISKNKNLTVLNLSSDFEINAQDTSMSGKNDYARLVRCYIRRLKATQDIALACPQLQHCNWIQLDQDVIHPFIVEEQMPVIGGNVTRVVRGFKQHWMGRDHDTEEGIVKCKLEDLPGDIIGQNDVE